MPKVPPDIITWLDIVSVNQQEVITLSSDEQYYKATCSFPTEPSLKKGDKLRIMQRNPTAVLVRRIINGQLDDIIYHLAFVD